MTILVRANNDEECILIQKLLNTFGYSWPMSDPVVYTIDELFNEHHYLDNDDGAIIFETDEYKTYRWGTSVEMPGNVLTFEEFLNEIENNGGKI